jgi:aminomethyltransferase
LKSTIFLLPNSDGGIVDDLLVYKMKEQYLLVVNASNIDKDWDWISAQNDLGVEMKNLSDDYSLLAIQGPSS